MHVLPTPRFAPRATLLIHDKLGLVDNIMHAKRCTLLFTTETEPFVTPFFSFFLVHAERRDMHAVDVYIDRCSLRGVGASPEGDDRDDLVCCEADQPKRVGEDSAREEGMARTPDVSLAKMSQPQAEAEDQLHSATGTAAVTGTSGSDADLARYRLASSHGVRGAGPTGGSQRPPARTLARPILAPKAAASPPSVPPHFRPLWGPRGSATGPSRAKRARPSRSPSPGPPSGPSWPPPSLAARTLRPRKSKGVNEVPGEPAGASVAGFQTPPRGVSYTDLLSVRMRIQQNRDGPSSQGTAGGRPNKASTPSAMMPLAPPPPAPGASGETDGPWTSPTEDQILTRLARARPSPVSRGQGRISPRRPLESNHFVQPYL